MPLIMVAIYHHLTRVCHALMSCSYMLFGIEKLLSKLTLVRHRTLGMPADAISTAAQMTDHKHLACSIW